MIIVLKQGHSEEQLERLMTWLRGMNLDINVSKGAYSTILGLIGDTSVVDTDLVSTIDIVDTVTRVSEPYKTAIRLKCPPPILTSSTSAASGSAADISA